MLLDLQLPRVDAGDPGAHLLVGVLGVQHQQRRVHVQLVFLRQILHACMCSLVLLEVVGVYVCVRVYIGIYRYVYTYTDLEVVYIHLEERGGFFEPSVHGELSERVAHDSGRLRVILGREPVHKLKFKERRDA